MNSTLYNGYSGIKTHQFGLDSISNNIANINTTGYRANMPEFKSLFSSALDNANPNSPIASDMNYGSTSASNAISNIDGSYKESDEELSVAYAGKGWFVVANNENDRFNATDVSQDLFYTRDGSFSRDAQGYIVNSSGYYMMGVNLGKIQNNVFISNPNDDEANLATNALQPIQIPQDLHYGPTQSKEVKVAINLNKSQSNTNANNLFLDKDNKINMQKILKQDINSLLVDNENINTSSYNDINIKLINGDEIKEFKFNYGEGPNNFKTIEELINVIKDQTKLDVEFAKLPDGSINPKLMLEIKNKSINNLDVEIDGKLATRIGINGKKELKIINVTDFNPNQIYNVNDLTKVDGAIFKKIEGSDKTSPLEDSNNWILLDTSGVKKFNENEDYDINKLVNYEGNIYQKLNDTKTNPKDNPTSWKLIGKENSIDITQFNEDKDYTRNSFVYFNGQVYKKIGDSKEGMPDKDTLNWQLLSNDSFSTKALDIPNYKATSEFYDENGDKLLIISQFILNNMDTDQQTWEVESAIYNKDGSSILGDKISHNISFSMDGKIINKPQPITLKYGDKEINYDISGSNNKESSGYSYVDSSITDIYKDGAPRGELANIGIDENGIINLSFSNGVTEPMGRIGIVAFVNDQGLSKIGSNLLQISSYALNGEDSTISTGEPLTGWDENGKLRFGQVLHKYLETSNVNPADAMTDLIVYQRGYSMNAKAFTTGDDLIKEAINLKR